MQQVLCLEGLRGGGGGGAPEAGEGCSSAASSGLAASGGLAGSGGLVSSARALPAELKGSQVRSS